MFYSVVNLLVHFVFVSDISTDLFDIFLCNDSHCSISLSELCISLPSHSSFQQYSNENRYYTQNPTDHSPQSLLHLSPYQLNSYKYISIQFKNQTTTKSSIAQFYEESRKYKYSNFYNK